MNKQSSGQMKNNTLYFRLKHLRSDIFNHILKKAGWSSLNQFEMDCNNDKFQIDIENGVMCNIPDYDKSTSDKYHTQEIALHHLNHEFIDILIKHLDVSSVIEYEIYNSLYNAIYISIPYRDYWMTPVQPPIDTTQIANNKHSDKKEVLLSELMSKDQYFSFGNSNHIHINTGYKRFLEGMCFKDITNDRILLYKPNIHKIEWNCVKYWNNLDRVWECFPFTIDTRDFRAVWDNKYEGWVVDSDYFEAAVYRGAKYLKPI
tara:strand:+ start:674 stop:1453 length:780 start_codon:yes stop_codon:yes gene_type:complete